MNSHSTQLANVLLGQHVTEKGTRIASAGQYLFKVHPCATKVQIKRAVEANFSVKVAAVNTVNMMGKQRRFGKTPGRRSDWKKAYITLMQGYSINVESETVKD